MRSAATAPAVSRGGPPPQPDLRHPDLIVQDREDTVRGYASPRHFPRLHHILSSGQVPPRCPVPAAGISRNFSQDEMDVSLAEGAVLRSGDCLADASSSFEKRCVGIRGDQTDASKLGR